MKSQLLAILFVGLLSLGLSCHAPTKSLSAATQQFSTELRMLKNYFKIPGMAAIVAQNGQIVYEDYLGFSDQEKQIKVDSATAFPIASITKVFAGVVTLNLAEQGFFQLEDPANKYLSKSNLGDSILIKHLLSHTSQGAVGKHFYYSSRFSLLTEILEKATGKSFKNLLQEAIFQPLVLKETVLLTKAATTTNLKLAAPYLWEGETKAGPIEYGYSASAGVVSTARDLLRFSTALDENSLLIEGTKTKMFTASQENLPYGYGIFTQQLEGLSIVWAYGQYDGYASLLLKVPAQNLTLILLANNNLMSDPARLIYGDVGTSLFALSFLKNYLLTATDIALLPSPSTINFAESTHPKLLRKIVLAQALAESFLARYEPARMDTSKALLKRVFQKYPDERTYGGLSLLHNLSFLKDLVFYLDLAPVNDFDDKIERLGKQILQQQADNPYAHLYLGTYYGRKGKLDTASFHFKQIVTAPNFTRNWYVDEAEAWLNAQE